MKNEKMRKVYKEKSFGFGMMNKKGDESSNQLFWVIGGILLALIVFALIVYAYYNGYLGGKALISMVPIETLDAKALACGGSAAGATMAYFCTEFSQVEIYGQPQLINCEFPLIKEILTQKNDFMIESYNKVNCVGDPAKIFCESLSAKDREKIKDVKVNDKTCVEWNLLEYSVNSVDDCAAQNGNLRNNQEECAEQSEDLLVTYTDGTVCCVAG